MDCFPKKCKEMSSEGKKIVTGTLQEQTTHQSLPIFA